MHTCGHFGALFASVCLHHSVLTLGFQAPIRPSYAQTTKHHLTYNMHSVFLCYCSCTFVASVITY